MKPKIKNIILFTSIALVIIVAYVVLMGKKKDDSNIVTSSPSIPSASPVGAPLVSTLGEEDKQRAEHILSLLLSVRGITLDKSIFLDNAFLSLTDSTKELLQDGTEGRINPFAPIGADAISASAANSVLPKAEDNLVETKPLEVPEAGTKPPTTTQPKTQTPSSTTN